ncbi:MAG: SUF system NifU family Fe-S cluster assembly protein [Deltaproteobacteria bacterium]|nr:SUF system NifU family Fe-S cluster assembly protein [Deltaproteobacteria bacterium]
MDHSRHPRNRGGLEHAHVIRRGKNPQCGDDVEVGIEFGGETLAAVRFRGRACAICIASASMMTEVLSGRNRADAYALAQRTRRWLNQNGGEEPSDLPPPLESLQAVRGYPARRRCLTLPWEALSDGLAAALARDGPAI